MALASVVTGKGELFAGGDVTLTNDTRAGNAGFTKDQLKVEVDPSGSLKISGERAVNGGRQWCHFLKRYDFPGGRVDAAAIKVQLDKGVLYVQVPHPSAAADVGGSEQHPTEPYEDALQEEETTGAVWSGRATPQTRDEHPAWRLAKSLSKHRQVVLNVVLAVVLLWLVAFAKNKPGGGQVKNE